MRGGCWRAEVTTGGDREGSEIRGEKARDGSGSGGAVHEGGGVLRFEVAGVAGVDLGDQAGNEETFFADIKGEVEHADTADGISAYGAGIGAEHIDMAGEG